MGPFLMDVWLILTLKTVPGLLNNDLRICGKTDTRSIVIPNISTLETDLKSRATFQH